MSVLITGVTGSVGQIAAKRLRELGEEVIGFASDEAFIPDVAAHHVGCISDFAALKEAMTGCDRVLHLAAYRMPYDASEQEIFRINVGGTFNVFKACADLGIRRITVASSPNAIGYNFGIDVREMTYLPVDGAHPVYTTDPYSFSKQSIEEIGRYFYRRHGISSVFLRLGLDFRSTIDEWMQGPGPSKVRQLRRLVDELLTMPQAQRVQAVQRIESEMNAARRRAFVEMPPFKNGMEYVYSAFTDALTIWGYLVHNFLMYLDCRDLASAIACALNAPFVGAHNLFVADHKNMLGLPAAALAELLYPGARIDPDLLQGYDALVDYRETERIIGFRAQHTLMDYYEMMFG